jgi:PIN domain nuclease of toxin-antitoxin system
MRVLLDTHILLWCLQGSKKLPAKAVDIVQSADEVYASVVSLWEMAIKYSLGKLNMDIDFAELEKAILVSGYEYLPVEAAHTVQLVELPYLHRDPFDRMLVAQSIVEPLRLVTRDSQLARYGSTIIKV